MYATDELYTVRQAGAFLGVGELIVRQMVQRGQLRAWPTPNQRTLLVRKRDLLPFLDPGADLPTTRQLPLFADDARRGAA